MQSSVPVHGTWFWYNAHHINIIFSNRRQQNVIQYELKWSCLWTVLALRISNIKRWFGPTQHKRIPITWTEICQHMIILLNLYLRVTPWSGDNFIPICGLQECVSYNASQKMYREFHQIRIVNRLKNTILTTKLKRHYISLETMVQHKKYGV